MVTHLSGIVGYELTNVGGAGSCMQFSDRHCRLPTEEIMGAINSIFSPKFPQNGGFKHQMLHLWMTIF